VLVRVRLLTGSLELGDLPTTNPTQQRLEKPTFLTEQVETMRLWSIHPCHLDAKGLVACWREG